MSLSKKTASAEESSEQNYISVCGICLSVYEVPKALPCLHSFCLECIREWAAHKKDKATQAGNQRVTCPNCRKECILPVTGVDGLTTNFFITERNKFEKSPPCNSCRKADPEIVARCHECGFICKDCLLAHNAMLALENHAVIELDKLRIGKAVKQAGNLGIGVAKRLRKPGDGIFKLEKVIDLVSTQSCYNAWCCRIVPFSASKFQIAVPTHKSIIGKVYVFGIDGKQTLTIDTTVGLDPGRSSSPWDIAVNSDGDFHITDCNPWVKVHDSKGQFKHLFQIFDTSGARCAEGEARGLVIDSKQQIIVGDIGINTISIYRPDESYVNSFKVDICPYFLAGTCRDTLLVSTNGGDKLLEVDYSGKVLYTITSPIKNLAWELRGACCSEDGEIFVVNVANNKCSVYRFTNSWQYTGCVISDLEDPRGIAISEDGELLVVIDTRYKVKIFRRA